MNVSRVLAGFSILIAAAGCSTLKEEGAKTTLIPSQALNISQALSIPLEGMVAAGVLYAVIDPLAPNWHIEQTQLGEHRYRIALRKKRFTTGGDGEVMPAFYRRAEQIAKTHGSARYRVIEFSEGIDSEVLVARRVAQGVVEVVRP